MESRTDTGRRFPQFPYILARGDTHMPFAQPLFGTPCAANSRRPSDGTARATATSMTAMNDGMIDTRSHALGLDED